MPTLLPIMSYFSKCLHWSAVSYLRLSRQRYPSFPLKPGTNSQPLTLNFEGNRRFMADLRRSNVSLEGLNFLYAFRLCVCSDKHRILMLTPVCSSTVTTGPQSFLKYPVQISGFINNEN